MTIGWIVFACVFGGALFGISVQSRLPQHHLSSESKDIVKLGMGLIATMTALLLGLLIATAKGSYDTEKSEIIQMSAKIIFLDRVLSNFGPESQGARDLLRSSATRAADRIWPHSADQAAQLDPTIAPGELLYIKIHELNPQTDLQKDLKSEALSLANDFAQMRWLLFEQSEGSIPGPFLIMVVSWLTFIFISFGLMSPPNATVITTLLICALSVSGAIILILELDGPFDGLIQVSSRSMRDALMHLGR